MSKNITELNKEIEETYNSMLYTSHAHHHSNPHRLSAVATLFGLEVPPVETARILELGCSRGGNSLPIAVHNPRATVVGVDLSASQIAIAQEAAKSMQLSNITFQEYDINEIGTDFGKFDYIICHGVYSWVPKDVQKAIRRVCRECLTENGVAFISYNTYPGWKGKEILRDVMLYQVNDGMSLQEKVSHGRGLLEFLDKNIKGGTMRSVLDESCKSIMAAESSYIAHEYYEKFNLPQYFSEFLQEINEDGLSFVAESAYSGFYFSGLETTEHDALVRECGEDWMKFQQFLDYIRNRTFRRSIICKKEHEKNINRGHEMSFSTWDKFHLHGKYSFNKEEGTYLNLLTGITVRTPVPALLDAISDAYPCTVSVKEFVQAYLKDTPIENMDKERLNIYTQIAALILHEGVDFYTQKIVADHPATDFPKVHEKLVLMAKYLSAKRTMYISFFTKFGKTFNQNKAVLPYVISKMDGKHSIKEIKEHLHEAVNKQEVIFNQGEKVLVDDAEIDAACEKILVDIVELMKLHGMLE